MNKTVYIIFVLLLPSTAEAYIGPGMGAGTIGVVLGILASILLGLIAILWYPLKRFFRKMKKNDESTKETSSDK